jgi:predicted secreted protein
MKMTIPTKQYGRQAASLGQATSGTPPRLMKDTKLLMHISRSTRKLGIRIFKVILAIVGGLTGALIVTALGFFSPHPGNTRWSLPL